jgi:cell division initiation protein
MERGGLVLTPLDIQNKKFQKEFRGYEPVGVDQFMAEVAKNHERLLQENMDLKENVERLTTKLEHYQHMETTLHSTLVIAQETAEEVKLNAKRECELMMKEMEVRGQRMLDEASAKVRRMNVEYEELRKQAQVFRIRQKTLLAAQLEMLKKDEEDDN